MTMEGEGQVRGHIIQALRSNSKGMTITDISRKIHLNRNSTAKYLEVLRVNGQIDMAAVGRAKVFYISHRVPISALLNFSTDLILVLDSSMGIIDVNDNFQKTFKVKKEILLDVGLQTSNLPIFNTRESIAKIKRAIKGKDSIFEMKILLNSEYQYFRGKLIPSTLGDGNNGVTIIMENITDQKQAEDNLRKSEERYRELIENQGEGIGMGDENDLFIFANPAAERIMGVGPGKLIGMSVLDFVLKKEKRKIDTHSERRKKGIKDTYQFKIRSGDGKLKVILLTATPRYDRRGEFIGSFGVFRDITLMKENERRTRESEERYRALFESSSDSIIILKDRTIIQCNPSTLRMFGYSTEEEIIGLDPTAISPEHQPDGTSSDTFIMQRMRTVNEKGFVNFTYVHKRKGGDEFLADVRLHKVRLEEGTVIQAVIRDITEVVKAQEEISKKEERLSNILSSLHGSFIGLLDRNLKFIEFWGTEDLNEKYMTEWRLLKGMSILDFTPDHARDGIKDGIGRTFQDGTPFRVEHKAVLPAGGFWQDWSFSPFRNKDGEIEYVIQFGRDTHEKNIIMEALKNVKKRYDLLDMNVSDVIWMTDLDLNYTYISSSITNLLGYSSEELLGISVTDTLTERSTRNVKEIMKDRLELMRSGKGDGPPPITLEVEQLTKKGTNVWTEVSISFLTDEDGAQQGLMGVTRNIDERKEARSKIRNNERRLMNILSSLHGSFIGLITRDHLYEVFWGSKELDELYGIDPNTIIGRSALDMAPPSKKDDLKRLIDSVFLTGQPVQLEARADLPNGQFWQMHSFSPFRNDAGEIEYVIQFGSDTTEKNKVKEQLEKRERP